jgi:hypothetical protein
MTNVKEEFFAKFLNDNSKSVGRAPVNEEIVEDLLPLEVITSGC